MDTLQICARLVHKTVTVIAKWIPVFVFHVKLGIGVAGVRLLYALNIAVQVDVIQTTGIVTVAFLVIMEASVRMTVQSIVKVCVMRARAIVVAVNQVIMEQNAAKAAPKIVPAHAIKIMAIVILVKQDIMAAKPVDKLVQQTVTIKAVEGTVVSVIAVNQAMRVTNVGV